MSPLDVIEIPGYPGWFARRVAVEAWQRAGSPRLTSAGRLYASQKYLWDGWAARLPGFNPADNPDDETQRLAHVRFVAFDLANPNHDRAAMQRAGFTFPYSYEPWHAELPNVRSYAIVRDIPSTAGGNARPIPDTPTPTPTLEDDMPTLITSAGGQSLAIEGVIVPLTSPAEVQSIKITPGVLECSRSVHERIQAIVGANRSTSAAIPLRVFDKGGNGTVYILQDGKLRPLVDPTTLTELDAKDGPTITLSHVEVQNLLQNE
ncbi:hypothetical protein [Microbacterium kyungheense]|uniref:Uncharacterized protein n=1 Tax=Microbacterium kyungheense TaxID=1263636 RepID=A0A543EU81_9MICO|nr:hypothetical protein [Microbacterium kyungheense]TQM25120.1 hypothetical protein FB391_2579 [Microbacterium kyungheense]